VYQEKNSNPTEFIAAMNTKFPGIKSVSVCGDV
jgi:hypothetical protein